MYFLQDFVAVELGIYEKSEMLVLFENENLLLVLSPAKCQFRSEAPAED